MAISGAVRAERLFARRGRSGPSLLDGLLLTAVLVAVCWLGVRVATGFSYQWNWGAIPQFLVRYDAQSHQWVSNYLLQGLFTTLRLSLWAGLLALAAGLFLALCRISGSLYLRLWARTYIELMRNLPPLVLIFLFSFFLADQLLPRLGLETLAEAAAPWLRHLLGLLVAPVDQLSAFVCGMLTLAAFEAAYVAEILRAGIESIHRSQWDGAAGLGLTRAQSLRHVILPQAVRRVLPPLAGQMISLVKDSAIVSVISIQELTYQGTQLMASTYLTVEVWLTVAGLYFLLTFPCSLAVDGMEAHLRRRKKTAPALAPASARD